MEPKNCKRCGKIFSYTGNHLCPDCIEKEDQEFKLVKDYIYENPKCSAYEVSEATGVSVRTIISFLKQDRLQEAEGLSGLLVCEKCGVPVKSGRHCEKCASQLKRDTKKVLNESTATTQNIREHDEFKGKSRIYVRDEKSPYDNE